MSEWKQDSAEKTKRTIEINTVVVCYVGNCLFPVFGFTASLFQMNGQNDMLKHLFSSLTADCLCFNLTVCNKKHLQSHNDGFHVLVASKKLIIQWPRSDKWNESYRWIEAEGFKTCFELRTCSRYIHTILTADAQTGTTHPHTCICTYVHFTYHITHKHTPAHVPHDCHLLARQPSLNIVL